jgi:hypothetical protein
MSLLVSILLFIAYVLQYWTSKRQTRISDTQNEITENQTEIMDEQKRFAEASRMPNLRAPYGLIFKAATNNSDNDDELEFGLDNFGGGIAQNLLLRTETTVYGGSYEGGNTIQEVYDEIDRMLIPAEREDVTMHTKVNLMISRESGSWEDGTHSFAAGRESATPALRKLYRGNVYEVEIAFALLYEDFLGRSHEMDIDRQRAILKHDTNIAEFMSQGHRIVTVNDSTPRHPEARIVIERNIWRRELVNHRFVEGIEPKNPTHNERQLWDGDIP